MSDVSLSKKHRGFTLIELIVVIVIAGIILVTVATRLLGNSEFSAYTTRDILTSELRLAQLRAMNDRSACYAVQITSGDIGIYQATLTNGVCSSLYTSTNNKTSLEKGVTVTIAGVSNTSTTRQILFDNIGRPSGGNCTAGSMCTLGISSGDTLSLCIESEGFVHDC